MFEEEWNVTKQMMLQLGADRNTNLGHHNSMERIAVKRDCESRIHRYLCDSLGTSCGNFGFL